MTYCSVFKSDRGLIFTSDTIVTSSDKLADSDLTIFNESTKHSNFEVCGGSAKFLILDDSRVTVFSGESKSIGAASIFLKENLGIFSSPTELFSRLNKSVEMPAGSASAILGYYNEIGEPVFGLWRANQDYFEPNDWQGATIGSSIIKFDYLCENSYRNLKEHPNAPLKALLTMNSAYHQLMAIHGNTVSEGFGGAFSSVALNENGLTYQPDITYYYYSDSEFLKKKPRLESFVPINVLIREGIVFVQKNVPEQTIQAYFMQKNHEELEALIQKHGPEVYEKALKLACETKVFVSREYRKCSIVFDNHKTQMVVEELSTGNMNMTINNPALANTLIAPPILNDVPGSAFIQVFPDGFLQTES